MLLVPFAYFFFRNKKKLESKQRKYLEEFFWRMSLSYQYSSSTESRLAQDIKRIDLSHKGPVNEKVQELIIAGESDTIEFKSTLRYDLRAKSVNKKLEYAIAKTIIAFLNSEGGDLFIGIGDNQNAFGLSDDIETLSKNNIDGFKLHLIEVIKKYIGGGYSAHIKVTFPVYDDVQVCRIRVAKSSKPVFTQFEGKEDFFVRSGCSSQPLSREEQSAYEKEHWSN